jgi:hypothetical protein
MLLLTAAMATFLFPAAGDFDFNLTHCAGKLPGGCGVVFEVQP